MIFQISMFCGTTPSSLNSPFIFSSIKKYKRDWISIVYFMAVILLTLTTQQELYNLSKKRNWNTTLLETEKGGIIYYNYVHITKVKNMLDFQKSEILNPEAIVTLKCKKYICILKRWIYFIIFRFNFNFKNQDLTIWPTI